MTDGRSERERRLAEALRANLRRRKGQARDRAAGVEALAPESARPSDESGKA